MAVTVPRVFMAVTALWCFSVEGTPVSVMHGDLCRKMNGRKYYLEADTHAIITATNVTLPTFPDIALQQGNKNSASFHHAPRRHRREGPQEIGVIMEPRYRRNITSITLTSLGGNILTAPTSSFVTPPESTRILTPLRTPTLEEHVSPQESPSPASPEGSLPTSSPLLVKETEDLEVAPEVTTTLTQPLKCGVEILTRPDCHLELTFEKVNLPSCSHDKSCRCDYLRLREPPYRGNGGLDICSMGDETPEAFTSLTKEVRMDFLYTRGYEDALAIGITAKRNMYRIIGKMNSTVGNIRSPFFPELYPKEHWMEYDLVAKEEKARIKVTFLDFQLSPWSFVEIQDTNNTRLAVFNGNLFRPPVLISSGPQITVRFSGNGETARGFNLEYTFIDAESNAMVPPITDCGGYVTNFGGTITMMNMSKDSNYTMYDCVWIVQPPQNYAFKSHLSIKVVQFEQMASATTLEIRQGVTSDDYLLEKIEGGDLKRTQEHVVAVDTGFYVRLRGFFNKDSKLAIVYSSFSYLGSCYSMTDLMCHNHRCIPKMLRCDGFDHCGDNSDEPTSCYVGAGSKGLTPEDAAWWYQHTPNYYFPPKSSFLGGQHGWSGVLLLTSLIIMVILMVALISYMFKQSADRVGRERRHGLHSRRGSISDDVEIVDASADDPPLYEPPPDYEEVIKVILSGNNLKLVRRPGGLTAWVPDKLVDGGSESNNQPKSDRPVRTRHASLDLERGMEVVLWNSNSGVPPRNTTTNAVTVDTESGSPSAPRQVIPFHVGHIRRSSLPTAPTPETMHHQVQGHSVSIAPETIPEGPESLESPRPPIRHVHTLSSPQISIRSFNYDTSAVSTPGPSTPKPLQLSNRMRKSKKGAKKGGKRKKSSAVKKPERQAMKDDSAPPSYEDAMQQVINRESHSPMLSGDGNLSSDTASHVNESTQTSLDQGMIIDAEDLSPTDRVHAARELFQKLSNGQQKPGSTVRELHGNYHIAKRPAVQVNKTRHLKNTTSGGTISRGTVKARKAMLLKSQNLRRDCECNGACSCAHFKAESPAEETPAKGGVKSKVQYYLKIEEGTKKRDYDSSIEKSPVEQELETTNEDPTNLLATGTTQKKKKLVRNKSAPTIGRIRDLDLDIYFSQNEEISGTETPSPSEDMERPLITPVNDASRPVFIVPMNSSNGDGSPKQDKMQSIQSRVKHYNDLTRPKSPSVPPRTPSPLNSPIQCMKLSHFLRSASDESLDENDGVMVSMRSVKNAVRDANIKPGLVREATAKFITTLATDIHPKLCSQNSEEWNTSEDSPLPIRIPYLNLQNETPSSPEISDSDGLNIPPLKREEAESIELWDSISQGISETEGFAIEASGDLPPVSSGAVPKKSAGEVTIKLRKKTTSNTENQNKDTKFLLEEKKEEKTDTERSINRSSPESSVKVIETSNKVDCIKPSSDTPTLILEEVNLGPRISGYESSSDDESLPSSPSFIQKPNEKLNETFDSEVDIDVFSKPSEQGITVTSPSKSDSQSSVPKRAENTRKIPIPSPRGSKISLAKASLEPQIASPTDTESPLEPSSKEELTSAPASPVPQHSSAVLKEEAASSSTQVVTDLATQMEHSGIVTINSNNGSKRDYI
ncbi:LOW QUALITY PROTEIN: uncharacterized protein LOC135201001 [Macrobrachium nipponense]|uniref:LOW QUALITY PROTEIN: uncharacterized protein LOC135201001 n=1 Tax=Macrobrachium nipponense TaxID=159736 RepID=UPI0030C7D210